MIFITGIDQNGKDKEYLVLSDNLIKVIPEEDNILIIETINAEYKIKFRSKYDMDRAICKLKSR